MIYRHFFVLLTLTACLCGCAVYPSGYDVSPDASNISPMAPYDPPAPAPTPAPTRTDAASSSRLASSSATASSERQYPLPSYGTSAEGRTYVPSALPYAQPVYGAGTSYPDYGPSQTYTYPAYPQRVYTYPSYPQQPYPVQAYPSPGYTQPYGQGMYQSYQGAGYAGGYGYGGVAQVYAPPVYQSPCCTSYGAVGAVSPAVNPLIGGAALGAGAGALIGAITHGRPGRDALLGAGAGLVGSMLVRDASPTYP